MSIVKLVCSVQKNTYRTIRDRGGYLTDFYLSFVLLRFLKSFIAILKSLSFVNPAHWGT